ISQQAFNLVRWNPPLGMNCNPRISYELPALVCEPAAALPTKIREHFQFLANILLDHLRDTGILKQVLDFLISQPAGPYIIRSHNRQVPGRQWPEQVNP